MLGIKIGTEFLDLNPGTSLERELNNPFLQFNNELMGDFSYPFEVKPTSKNLRLLQYAGVLQNRVDIQGIDASAWDGGLQDSIGKVKVEKPVHHLNNMARGAISLYYLGGASNFYQDIKDVKLRDVDFGGDRSFVGYTDGNRFDRNRLPGFWGHIHQVIDAPTGYGMSGYDYAFFPVINDKFSSSATATDIMNAMKWNGSDIIFTTDTVDGRNINPICPFPYLKYVLQKAVTHVGWAIQGDVLNDTDFKKVVLVNTLAIDWGAPALFTAFPHDTITFDLADHMPNVGIAELLIALKNRFGWWYDFDRRNKVITIKSLKDVAAVQIKDMSRYASPVITKTINKEQKIYAIKQTAPGNYSDSPPNLKNVFYQGLVQSESSLPAAGQSNYRYCYLNTEDNNYYVCRWDGANYVWKIYGYNVYNYEPDGFNEEITTATGTVAHDYYPNYLDGARLDLEGSLAGYDEGGNWGIHLAFNFGRVPNHNGHMLPLGSSGIYDYLGVQRTEWSLAFECKKHDGTDVGLYQNWKPILDLLKEAEKLEVTLHLNKVDYMNLKFSDVIAVNGVRMYIKTIKAAIPYRNAVVVEGVRI